jgi:twitching motility protein PilT
MNITQLLEMATQHQASDLHLSIGYPPMIRKHGRLQKLQAAALTADEMSAFCYQLTPVELREIFLQELDLDLSLIHI